MIMNSTRHIERKVTVNDKAAHLTIEWSSTGWIAKIYSNPKKFLEMEQSAIGMNRERIENLHANGSDDYLVAHVQLVFDFCESLRFEV